VENEKRAFYERGWFTVLMLVIFFPVGLFLMWKYQKFNMVIRVIISTVLGIYLFSSITSTDEETAEPAPVVVAETPVAKEVKKPVEVKKEEPQKPKIQKLQMGESVEFGGMKVTFNSVRKDFGNEFMSPENDFHLIADLTVENTTNKEENVSSLLNLSLKDADGYKYSDAIFADTKGTLNGSISAGDKLRGEIAFDVPESGYDLIYSKKYGKRTSYLTFQVQ
jgi:hypothetical protein